jgi:hypothetical protein
MVAYCDGRGVVSHGDRRTPTPVAPRSSALIRRAPIPIESCGRGGGTFAVEIRGIIRRFSRGQHFLCIQKLTSRRLTGSLRQRASTSLREASQATGLLRWPGKGHSGPSVRAVPGHQCSSAGYVAEPLQRGAVDDAKNVEST